MGSGGGILGGAANTGSTNSTGVGSLYSGVGAGAATAGSLFSIAQGLQKGGVTGNAQAALGSASLANRAGAFGGASSSAGSALGIAGGGLGIYNGIQQGGVSGYGGAAVGALRVGAGAASLAGDSALSTGLGAAAGYAAAPLAVYNAVENYQSGNYVNNTLNDAAAGAAVGSVVPVIGTAIGAVVGGAIGLISSAIGPGKTDPETQDVNQLINATSAHGNTSQIAAGVQNPYVQLAGLFDDKSSTLPMYQQYGRMGEQKFTQDFASQLNTAIQKDPALASNPQQAYNQVIAPWVQSMGKGWSNVGATYTSTTQGLLQDMTQEYLSGNAAQDWKSVGGQNPFSNIYNGSPINAAPAPIAAPTKSSTGQSFQAGQRLV